MTDDENNEALERLGARVGKYYRLRRNGTPHVEALKKAAEAERN